MDSRSKRRLREANRTHRQCCAREMAENGCSNVLVECASGFLTNLVLRPKSPFTSVQMPQVIKDFHYAAFGPLMRPSGEGPPGRCPEHGPEKILIVAGQCCALIQKQLSARSMSGLGAVSSLSTSMPCQFHLWSLFNSG
jgi:hypothetical protein